MDGVNGAMMGETSAIRRLQQVRQHLCGVGRMLRIVFGRPNTQDTRVVVSSLLIQKHATSHSACFVVEVRVLD